MENSYIVPETTLTEIADAIREKTGSTDNIAIEDFATNIINFENNNSNNIYTIQILSNRSSFTIYYISPETLQLTRLDLPDNTTISINSLHGIIYWNSVGGGSHSTQGNAITIRGSTANTSDWVPTGIIQCLEQNCIISFVGQGDNGSAA